jgi:hypothetical protein
MRNKLSTTVCGRINIAPHADLTTAASSTIVRIPEEGRMKTPRTYCGLFLILPVLLNVFTSAILQAQQLDPKYYSVGTPVLTQIWVDPVNGSDQNNGTTRSQALASLETAWSLIPSTTMTTGYKISLVAGDYIYRDQATNAIVGLYLDERHGTYNCPIIIEAVDGALSVRLFSALDFRDIAYVYLMGLDFVTDPSSDGGGNTVHFASGDHILLKNCRINGFDGTTRKPQETLKVNQVKYMYVENCDISGAFWFALDYVGVEYGHIQGCIIHDASEDCLLLKGGTAQIRIEDTIIHHADRFGFSAGQGAGFDFMVVPWLHYEAYDLKFINNIVYNSGYAGLAVLGGYNILIAYNTFYKVGIDQTGDRTLMSFNLGQRGCDGAENDTCNVHHQLGGWSPGPWSTPPLDYGVEVDCIPNKNVFVYDNIFYNPGSDSTIGGHLEIRAPYDGSDQLADFLHSCNLPTPVLSDDNLQIQGNIIWNGSSNKFLGIDENSGGQDTNRTCNRAQLLHDNIINTLEPEFVDTTVLNFHPKEDGTLFRATTYPIPDFSGGDRPQTPPVPLGNIVNVIPRDYDGKNRPSQTPPGAFVSSSPVAVNREALNLPNTFSLHQNYPNPFNPSTTIEYSISKSAFISLKVCDLLGRELATLVDENKPAGTYRATWDASGRASGVYFYRLEAGKFTEMKKLVLLK